MRSWGRKGDWGVPVLVLWGCGVGWAGIAACSKVNFIFFTLPQPDEKGDKFAPRLRL